jgi:uncharacterized protein (TIGR02996 family)
MLDADSLLRPILDAPDRDASRSARMVYADALLDVDDPRGLFIQQQMALGTRTGLEDDVPDLLVSTARALTRHGPEWVRPFADRLDIDPAHFGRIAISDTLNAVFVDGFLQRIAMRYDDLDAQYAAIAEVEPIEGPELLLPGPLDWGPHPVAKTWKILKISIDDWVTAIDLARVLNWDLQSLHALDVSGMDLGVDGAFLLAGMADELDLGVTWDDFIAPPPFAKGQLQELRLAGCKLGDAGLAALTTGDGLALQTLDASGNQLTAASREVWFHDALANLTVLSIAGNGGLGPVLDTLVDASWRSNLTHIGLPRTVTAEALEGFLRPSEPLRSLDLRGARDLFRGASGSIAASVIAAASPHWIELQLGTTGLGDAGLDRVLQGAAASLLVLGLAQASLTDAGVAMVFERLPRLVDLDISSNRLTNRTLEALAEWPGRRRLARLRIGNNRRLDLDGWSALIGCEGFDPAELDVGRVTDPALLSALRDRFGNALVYRR